MFTPKIRRASAARRPFSRSKGAGDGLLAYMRSVRRLPLLSREEEAAIATRYVQTRDPALARKLVEGNLRFVIRVALSYRNERGKLLDLIQEGNLGLMHAVQKFDPARGTKLITYAGPWVSAYIHNFVRSNKRLVKLGTTNAQRKLFLGAARTRARLEGLHGLGVTDAQIAAELEVPERDVASWAGRLGGLAEESLDVQSRGGDDAAPALADRLACPAPRADELAEARDGVDDITRAVAAARKGLNLRERCILDSRLLTDEPVTLASLAETFGVTRERVRQLEVVLKRKLAARLREDYGKAA